MQHFDLDALLDNDFETTKDAAFLSLVGHGQSVEVTEQESFENSQEFKRTYKQPNIFGISNDRGCTDSVYLPTHYDFDEAQQYAIEMSKTKHRFVEVTDKEIEEVRNMTRNMLSQGDAISLVLQSKLKEYNGLEDNVEEGSTEKSTGHIIDALYCAINKTTFYFLR